MAAKAKPGAVARCARTAKPFNVAMIALGIVLDGLVVGWSLLEGQDVFDPAVYAAVSVVLKAVNTAIHFLSRTTGSNEDGQEPNNG